MTLERYEEKRDFSGTNEPAPHAMEQRPGALTFVVQKHAASRLHYDFRLEFGGALKSWAVPKGPSTDNTEKRLAVLVEDHPLDYASFEGVIGDGNYGAGQVIVWDMGIYSPDEGGLSWHDREEAERRMLAGLDAGKLSFTLRGHKLQGSWTLVRTTRGPNEWLLIKHKDAHTDTERDVLDDGASVVCGLTLEQLRSGRLPDPSLAAGVVSFGKPARMPRTLKPMLAHAVDGVFSSPGWLFEPKLDGFRALAFLQDGNVRLISRTGKDMTKNFRGIADDLSVLPHRDMVLDGEIVALGDDGLPDFVLLQNNAGMYKVPGAESASVKAATVAYYPFDVLYLDGRDLRQAPLQQRKHALRLAVPPSERIRSMEYVDGEGEAFFRVAEQLGLEGIVAKRRDSRYNAGERSRDWLKIKQVLSQEFVIAGYTKGEGERAETFGAVALGYYDGGTLTYAGRAGSGFTQQTLRSTLAALEPLQTEACPFPAVPADLESLQVTWVQPERVAQVKFSQWTGDGVLRAPVFLGLRDDVQPRAIVRETPEPVSSVVERTAPASDAHTESRDVVEQLARIRKNGHVEIGGQRFAVTNMDKVFWPETESRAAVTKGDMLRYYAQVAPYLLPHLRDRPLTMTRYPNGIDGGSFYQKRWEHDLPPFAETVRLFSTAAEGDVDYLAVNNLATLIWLAQLADLELHPWLSRTAIEPDAVHLRESFTGSKEELRQSVLNYPDFIVFDLDPYIYSGEEKAGEEPELNRRAFAKGAEVALSLKDLLDQLSLSSFLKTSGKTGLHIYVPILREYDYAVTRKACELIGRFLLRQRQRDLTMEWSVSRRAGKIFLDHNMNVMGKNMASIYSLRPLPGAPVSVPLRWDELPDVYPSDFNIDTVHQRLADVGDLWGDILDAKHDLRRLSEAAGE
ncbi:MAG: ATP-dependent DNA ligase [Chloroflexi bacterium]|nr:ATP-dependent DNA ligase [Chloroflexota bacterium]MYK34878.1 ATP-dependent DNA ligase [Chloroflexota bacterium]